MGILKISDFGEDVSKTAFLSLTIPLTAHAWPCLVEAAPPLPVFAVDLEETSISGLSLGAYMAGQFHIAFSTSLKGAAIIAGGPYGCAQGQVLLALNQCMQARPGAPAPESLLARAQDLEQHGRIDPIRSARQPHR